MVAGKKKQSPAEPEPRVRIGPDPIVNADGTLSEKAERFVWAYVGTSRFNATGAAREVGYTDPEQAGWRLKKVVEVRARIDELLEAETLNDKEVLRELTAVATAPTTHFMQVTKVDEETGTLQVRQDYGSKLKALELLGKNRGLFGDKLTLTGADGGALQIEVVYEQGTAPAPSTPPVTG